MIGHFFTFLFFTCHLILFNKYTDYCITGMPGFSERDMLFRFSNMLFQNFALET